jgi:hypothetical protein
LIHAGLTVGGAVAAVLLFEIVLRVVGFCAPIWYRPDSHVGAVLRPGVEGWFKSEGRTYVRISSAGLRDREHSVEKPEGVYRVAVLGDSYSEAMQVDVKDAFWSVLGDKLTQCAYRPSMRIEVINFGVSGFGTAQEYLMLETVAMRYRPDLVLLQFMNGNDVDDNSIALSAQKMRPFFRLEQRRGLVLDASFVATRAFQDKSSALMGFARSVADHFRVVQLIRAFTKMAFFPRASADAAIEPGLKPAVLAAPRDSSWEDAWTVTERLILAMNEYLEKSGVPLIVVTTPFAIQVHPDRRVRETEQAKLGISDLFYPDRRIEAYARKRGIAVIPLTYEMQRLAESRRIYFHGFPNTRMGIGHWNENGHRVAAEIIARHLCSHHL